MRGSARDKQPPRCTRQLKAVPRPQVQVVISFQLPELGVVVASGEDVGASGYPEGVGYVVADRRPQVYVPVRGAVECEELHLQGLAQEKTRKPERHKMPELVPCGRAGGKGVPVAVV